MLKLIYSPYYDGNCFAGNPEKQNCTLGTKYVGDIGLLNELELRAGLSRGDVSPMRRAIEYCNAIQQVLNSNPTSNPFYKQSFENDPLGVARQLLSWRDALAMAGWSKQTKLPSTLSSDGKKRLSDLQEIEQYFDFIGIGERWQELLQVAQGRPILPQGTTITVEMKWDLLHPVIKKVFEAINKPMPGTVQESKAVANLTDDTLDASKFTLYEFSEQNDAYQWAVLQNFENAVFVNEDNFTFNQVLKSLGKPVVGASIKGSIPEMSQLLKLGISLFRSPVNYDNLIDYLSIFRHPIDSETRNALKYHLTKVGGFGDNVKTEKGKTTVTSFKSILLSNIDEVENKEVTENTDLKKLYSTMFYMWEKCTNDEVPVKDVQEYCKELLAWTETAMTKATAEKVKKPYVGTQICSQISILQEQIRSLQAFLKGKTGNIKNDELDKIVVSICQGDAVTTDQARLGSYDMLKDIKGLACEVGKVVWMDCVGKLRPRYAYSFMNPKDIDELQQNGLDIPNPQLEMLASDFAEKLAVSRADKIIALMPKRKDGERTEKHLLITELMTTHPAISTSNHSVSDIHTDAIAPKDANTQEIECKVKKSLLSNIKTLPSTDDTIGYKRKKQSFSSLNELINTPFDYLLDYTFDMKEVETGEDQISQTEGTVAHAVVSMLVTDSINDTGEFLNFCNNKNLLNEKLDKAIQEHGLELLLTENMLELCTFRETFITESIPKLAQIIEENDLEVEASEKDYGIISNIPQFNYSGFIDFVLKKKIENEDDYEYFIFDFKWNGSEKYKREEMLNCKELQLAIYEEIMKAKGMNVVMRGYYMLKQSLLLTTYDQFKQNDAIEVIPRASHIDIFQKALHSYDERVDNLFNGIIEEGAGLAGKEFVGTEFFKKYIPKYSMYHIDNGINLDARKTGLKGNKSSFGKHEVLKGKNK